MRQKTLSDLKYGDKHSKTWKMINAHCKEVQYCEKTENHRK